MSEVKNPCINVCKFRDEICQGCGRSAEETKAWKKLGKAEKRTVVAKAQKRLGKLKDAGRRKKA